MSRWTRRLNVWGSDIPSTHSWGGAGWSTPLPSLSIPPWLGLMQQQQNNNARLTLADWRIKAVKAAQLTMCSSSLCMHSLNEPIDELVCFTVQPREVRPCESSFLKLKVFNSHVTFCYSCTQTYTTNHQCTHWLVLVSQMCRLVASLYLSKT